MKTMIPLRLIGIASNVSFMSYALVGLQYGQNPNFGMFLIRLVSGYALERAIPKSAS